MFNNVSKAGTGISVMVLAPVIVALLGYLGVEVVESDVVQLLEAVLVISGFLLMLVGQWTRKDLKYGLFRK